MTQPKRPTPGQQRTLRLCSCTQYVLVAEQWPSAPEPEVNLRERATGRLVHIVMQRMYRSLLRAGWIERAPCDVAWDARYPVTATRYQLTAAGIAASNE